MPNPAKHFYEFGPFRLDTRERLLLREGQPVPLTPKVFDVLWVLVENRGHILEKDELLQAVWPESFVEEGNLNRNISTLRKALGEEPNEKQYIETVPRRGYRFVAEVRELEDEGGDLIVEKRTRARLVVDEEESAVDEEPKFLPADASLPRPRGWRPSGKVLALSTFVIGVAAVIVYLGTAHRQPAGMAVRSMAVLPFKPLVAGSSDEYLQLGMADVLITRLSNLKQIIVRPTNAVRKYAGLEQDSVAAGRELKVEAVLDGNIQRLGDRVRVTMRLVSVADGAPLWAEKFDEKFTDIFLVQDALSEKLAQALALKLSGEEKRLLTKRETQNTEAFQAYLKGRYFWGKWTGPGLQKSIEYFEQALVQDPAYALAHSGLADSYNLLGYLGIWLPRAAYPKSEAAAIQALKLDDTLGEAHLSLAKTKLFYDWDWPGFEREMKRALELNPNYADAHGMYGTYFLAMGRFDEAVRERQRAQELDPLSPLFTNAMGWSFFYAHQYDRAIDWYKKALELDPNFVVAHHDLGTVYDLKGSYDEAVAEFLEAKAISGASQETVAALKEAYAASGRAGYWRKELELANEQLAHGRVRPWRMAVIYTALGDRDQAFAWLNKAYEERASLLIFLKTNPIFDSLHSDPRFTDLLRRIGLAQ